MKLVDINATKETVELYEFLQRTIKDKKILFGHQNSTWISVSKNTDSDVRELTGDLPAIIGIDTLALSGNESTTASKKAAMNMSVELCKKAVKEGAIITLSGHMPNFSTSNIVLTDDGSYDFTKCDFMDTKDKANNCAAEILDGGNYNREFLAYLDMIVEFAKELEKDGIPVIFRPWHENNGEWFWWGSDIEVALYKKIYRYTKEYMISKDVHNFIYVYSPNGPFKNEDEYMERYPGDDLIDIMALDYYDDYDYMEEFRELFFEEMKESCGIISELASKHNKIAAISEVGIRVMKTALRDDLNGLLKEGNPMLHHDWFRTIGQIGIDNNMPYYLVWGNFCDTNHYLPYVKEDGSMHEMAAEFIDFYNWNKSIFANKR